MEVLSPYESASAPRRAWWWVLAWVALAVAITAGTLSIASGATSAADDLTEIRQFVADHPSGRFDRVETEGGGRDRRVTRTHGAFSAAGTHAVTSYGGGWELESIVLDRAAYTRTNVAGRAPAPWKALTAPVATAAEPRDGLISVEIDEEEDGSGGFMSYSTTSSRGDLPDGLLSVLGRFGVLTREGSDRLVATYRNRDLLTSASREAIARASSETRRSLAKHFDGEVRVELRHGPHGHLDAIVVESPGWFDDKVTRTETTYRDWGAAIQIEAPPAGEVDPTPLVEEQDLAAFVAGPVLAPTDLPEGWVLQSGTTLDRSDEDEDCASATLDYGPPGASEWNEMSTDTPAASVVLIEPDCPFLYDYQPDLMVGPHETIAGHDVVLHDDLDDFFLYSDFEEGIGATLRVPQGFVIVMTSEGTDVLRRLVASLKPYDSAATASATVKAPS